MKKILSFVLIVSMLLTCMVVFASCDTSSKVAGTYEMVSVTGSLTYQGETIPLDEDLYDYYRITLEKDGTALVESKGADSTSKIEEEGTWEYEDGVIKLKSNTSGITVVEEMEWKDDKITYVAEESGQGMKIKMTLILEKKK